jgi:DNA repair exonuclease SbcCD nuclease subunit
VKVLFVGDPHLKMSRFDISVRFLNWITELSLELKPDMVVNLGDSFDTHAVLRSELMQEFRKHVDAICSNNMDYVYVLGNHDQYKPNDATYHALQPFIGLYKNLIIADKPINYKDISFIPYVHNLRDFPTKTLPICVAHQSFVGVDYGYLRPDVGVDADKVSADVIISGHIHLRQEFGKVMYPGTPFAHNANDLNQEKGVMLFDTDTYKSTFIKSPFPMWRSIEKTIDQNFTSDDFHDYLSQSLTKADHWHVRLSGYRNDITNYMNSKKYRDLSAQYDIIIKPEYLDSDKKKFKIKAHTPKQVVKDFVDNVYSGSEDKQQLKATLNDLLDQVNS